MKKIGKIKRISVLCLIFLLSINSFATSISNNDGSAFITKAEFDALKSSFQKQIDTYNTNIDNKIDVAIASYLSNLKTHKDPINLLTRWKASVGCNPIWIKLADVGSPSSSGSNIVGALSETVNAANNLFWDTFSGLSSNFYCMLVANTTNVIANWGFNAPNMMRTMEVNKMFEDVAWGTSRDGNNWNSTLYPITYGNFNYMQQFSDQTNGSGKKWLYQTEGGRRYIKYFCPLYYVNSKIEYYGHYYKKFDFGSTQDLIPAAYFADNGKAFTTALPTIDVAGKKGTLVTTGTRGSDTATSNWNCVSIKSSITKVTDGKNYLNTFFSITSDKKIYAKDEEYQGEDGSTSIKKETFIIPDQSFANIYYSQSGGRLQTNIVKGPQFTYEPVTIKDDSSVESLNNFCNEGASNLISENVYHGGGMPIVEILDREVEFNIELKIKSTTNLNCKVTLSTDQFNNGSIPTSKLIDQKTVPTNQSSYYTFTIIPNDEGYIWIFIENTTNNEDVEIEDIKITKL